jgi:hypothetical protein
MGKVLWVFLVIAWVGFKTSFAQVQDFEESFVIVNHPGEFLPGWTGNDVRATASRIFQVSGEGIGNSRALAVQPLSTFTGVLQVNLPIADYAAPKITFFGKSRQNGTGNRPAMLFVSFSRDGGISFEQLIPIGDERTFPNSNQAYMPFEIPIPENLLSEDQIVARFEVRFGAGTGTAARFFMDNFALLEADALIDPIQVKQAYLNNPFTLFIALDREIEPVQLEQVGINGRLVQHLELPTDSTLLIYSNSELPENILLAFEGVRAKNGPASENLNIPISNVNLRLGEVRIINPEQLLLSFNKHIPPASASQTAHYRVNGIAPRAVVLEESGYEVLLELATAIKLDQIVNVVVSGIEGLVVEERRMLTYDDFIVDVFLPNAHTLELRHAIALQKEQFSAITFFLTDTEEIRLTVKSIDEEGMVVLESNVPLQENTGYQLQVPFRWSTRGLFLPGSWREVVYDTTPPQVLEAIPLSTRQLMLVFSEPVDPVFATLTGFYTLNDVQPIKATVQEQRQQVLLEWQQAFSAAANQELQVQGIPDLTGNFMLPQLLTVSFENSGSLEYRSIVINEVMAAPRANQILPNVEYLELYNNTDRSLPLSGMVIANSRRSTTLPPAILQAGGYVLLVPRNQAAQFTNFGSTLGLSNWPTLLNAADHIVLRDLNGKVIDSLGYATASYGSSALAQGGFSLEIVNPYNKCPDPNNLKPSTDARRGTPGARNSVFDQTSGNGEFTFVRSQILDDKKVVLIFNKPIDPNFKIEQIKIQPDLGTLIGRIGPLADQLTLELGESVREGVRYSVDLGSFRDCGGMLISGKAAFFIKPSQAEAGDVVINEVLFNPLSGSPKFVEIYNTSAKYINLRDWKLANLNSSNEIANRRTLFAEEYLVEPFSYLVFTTDAIKLRQDYPRAVQENLIELPSLPSYPISAGNVVLLNPDEDLTQVFSYSEKMHHRLLKEVKGVSLERISPLHPIDDLSNWQSASSSAGFATPGFKNSHYAAGPLSDGIQIEPKVFFPEGVADQSFTRISYQLGKPGQMGSIRIYGLNGQEIKEICQNAVWGSEGFYLWDGTDVSGRKVRPGYYVVWIQLFDMQGNVTETRKTVVVGTKF